jgi:hypothetical protein
MKSKCILSAAAAVFTILSAMPVSAQVSRPISKLPFVISKPGNYHLTRNLTLTKEVPTEGDGAIRVTASDVTINLNGRTLANAVNGFAGIYTEDNTVDHIRIRNGTIRGFEYGVFLSSNSGACEIEDLAVESCKTSGIFLIAPDSTVRRCTVRSTGGTATGSDTAGVSIFARGGIIENTNVSDTSPRLGGNGTSGISGNGDGALIAHCRVIQHGPVVSGSVGVRFAGKRVNVVDNSIANQQQAILLFDVSSKFRDNIITDCGNTTTGGTDSGNNR